jgi:hypothetical protein
VKKKLRRIVVQGQTYLWKFTPGYVATGDPANPWQCQDRFTAYLSQTKASPLHISFLTWEDSMIGGPLRTGIPLDLVVLQEIERKLNEQRTPCLFRLSHHSKELGNQGHLASHISFCHALQLSFPQHVHHLESL